MRYRQSSLKSSADQYVRKGRSNDLYHRPAGISRFVLRGRRMTPLICPVCKNRKLNSPLHREQNSLFCGARHCFDLAKSGCVTFAAPSGDDREMVASRTAFLETGAYKPFAEALASLMPDGASTIVDAGCGEGYYSNFFSEKTGALVLGFDLSKAAVNHAAKTAKSTGTGAFFAVAGIFDLPVASESVDVVTSIFAPISDEFERILKPGGLLIVGAAGKKHLYELKEAVYDRVYENEGRRDLPKNLKLINEKNISYKFTCEGDNIRRLFSMTPYCYKTSKDDRAKLDKLDKLEITADFDIFVYKK